MGEHIMKFVWERWNDITTEVDSAPWWARVWRSMLYWLGFAGWSVRLLEVVGLCDHCKWKNWVAIVVNNRGDVDVVEGTCGFWRYHHGEDPITSVGMTRALGTAWSAQLEKVVQTDGADKLR